MSGPKEGVWQFVRPDPTMTRLDDLSAFAEKQRAWLDRSGGFIRRYLGEDALASARAAYDRIQECIDAGDPDEGFDAYGAAWALFNRLHREAVEAKRRQVAEQQRRERERQDLARQRQQEALQRQREAAAALLAECRAAWDDAEDQALLARWGDRAEFHRLESALGPAACGSPEFVLRSLHTWQDALTQALGLAHGRAARNAQEVRSYVPSLRASLEAVGGLNVEILSSRDRTRFNSLKAALQREAEDALSGEDLRGLRSAIARLQGLPAEYQPKIKAAELRKASQVWKDALVTCGYAVSSRKGPDGSIIIEASSFPMKSLSVQVLAGTDHVKLDVNGKHDHAGCVKDVQSLQAELARQGIQLTMTDWGAGRPGGVQQQQAGRVTTGGAR